MTDATVARDHREEGAFATLRRGLRMMPEFRRGLPATFALALVATAGRVVVPIAIQQVIDRGLASGEPDMALITWLVVACAVVVVITAGAVFRMNVRLFRTTETALAGLRVRAFRHVHDLSVLHQQGERRGSLVSRVTSDVDQLSVFMQWGGVLGLISVGQLVVATVVMSFYSWQLTLLVLACFVPLAFAVRWFAKRLAAAYGVVRERVGDVLGSIAESVVGAPTVRAYGVRARTAARIDAAIDRHYRASVDAQKVTAAVFVTGEFVAAVANAAVVVVGVLLGLAGEISRRHADRLPVPRDAVRRAGADGQRGAERGAERRRRVPPGARRDRHRARHPRPRDRRPDERAPAARGSAGRPVRPRRPSGTRRARASRSTTWTSRSSRGCGWRSWGRRGRGRRRSPSWSPG